MEVDIIVVTYNQLALLRQSLYNLRRCTSISCRIIIVSDGSIDGTEKWLKTKEAEGMYDKVILKENGGVSSAFNCGIANTDNELVVTHHSDTILYEGWLESLLKVWETNQFDLVGTSFRNVIPLRPFGITFPLSSIKDIPCRGISNWPRKTSFPIEDINAVPVLKIRPHGNLMMLCSRELYQKYGGYIEFGSYGCNDAEFLDRVRARGARFAVLVRRITHFAETNSTILRQREESIKRNMQRLKSKKVHIPTYDQMIEKYRGRY